MEEIERENTERVRETCETERGNEKERVIERGSCSSAVFPYIQLSGSQVFSQVKLKRGSALGFAQVKLECGSVSERLPCIINLVMELTAGWRHRSNASGSVLRVDLTQNCQIHVLLSITA